MKDCMKPVSLENFGAHVSRMHAERDKWFEMEYNVSAFITPSSKNICIFGFLMNLKNLLQCSVLKLNYSSPDISSFKIDHLLLSKIKIANL